MLPRAAPPLYVEASVTHCTASALKEDYPDRVDLWRPLRAQCEDDALALISCTVLHHFGLNMSVRHVGNLDFERFVRAPQGRLDALRDLLRDARAELSEGIHSGKRMNALLSNVEHYCTSVTDTLSSTAFDDATTAAAL